MNKNYWVRKKESEHIWSVYLYKTLREAKQKQKELQRQGYITKMIINEREENDYDN